MAKKILDFNKLEAASKGAALSEKSQNKITGVRSKTLKNIPSRFFEAHDKLKQDGKTGLLFTGYILEALREKLERDNAL